jgi:hypothetical protein
VRPPPPGEVLLPAPDAPVVAVDAAPDGPVLAAPGLPGPGGIAVPGAGDGLGAGDGNGAPPPVVVPPPADVPPPVEPPVELPGEPPVGLPEEPPVVLPEEPPVEEVPEVPEPGAPGPPTGLTALRHEDGGDLVIDVAWTPPAGGIAPVEYEMDFFGDGRAGTITQPGTGYRDNDNYCSSPAVYTIRSVGPTGVKSVPAEVRAAEADEDCTPRPEVLSVEPESQADGGGVRVVVECATFPGAPRSSAQLVLLVDGVGERFTGCSPPDPRIDDRITFYMTGLAPGSTHTMQARTSQSNGRTRSSATVTVTTAR